jgi:hypothetical protein
VRVIIVCRSRLKLRGRLWVVGRLFGSQLPVGASSDKFERFDEWRCLCSLKLEYYLALLSALVSITSICVRYACRSRG